MRLYFERWYPRVFAILFAILAWKFNLSLPRAEKEFFAAAISLGAILAGFTATAQAILAALPSDSVMGKIRSSGYIRDLVLYLLEALYVAIAFCALNVIGFFLPEADGTMLRHLLFVAWAGLVIYMFLTFVRVASILGRIIR